MRQYLMKWNIENYYTIPEDKRKIDRTGCEFITAERFSKAKEDFVQIIKRRLPGSSNMSSVIHLEGSKYFMPICASNLQIYYEFNITAYEIKQI